MPDDRLRIHHQEKHYLMLNDTLYLRGVDTILLHCLTLNEAEHILNDCHVEVCNGHISGIATAKKILHEGYYWLTFFKYCIIVVQKCHPCQIFKKKMCAHPTPLHPVVSIGPFAKWGIDFVTCNPTSVDGHNYIVMAVRYFTKWAEAIPIFKADG